MSKGGLRSGNLGDGLPTEPTPREIVDILAASGGMRIERIVSTGQATPPGEWYDQPDDEWVVVISGAARLRIDGEDADRALAPGDWLLLPAHCRHRVTWTQASPRTVWLAVHVPVTGKVLRPGSMT